jgi:antitoxin VapB
MLEKSKPRRRVSVFKNGRSRAIRIPKEFDFGGDEMIIQQEKDGKLTLAPAKKKKSLVEVLDWLKEQGPMPDFPGDPGDADMLPLDDVNL